MGVNNINLYDQMVKIVVVDYYLDQQEIVVKTMEYGRMIKGL